MSRVNRLRQLALLITSVGGYPRPMGFNLSLWAQALLHGLTDYKLLFERSLMISPDAVHVLIGVILHLVVAALLRTSVAAWRPLIVVAVAQIANELLDFHYDIWPQLALQIGESVKDCLLTLVLPTILMLTARVAPGTLMGAPREEAV